MKRLTILILTVLCISCDNEEGITTGTFEVTTAGISIDCKLVLIDFKESDLYRIMKITNSNGLRYQAYNLDKNYFSAEGQTLTVTVRKTINSETFPCTAQGPGYPWVTVLDAQKKGGIYIFLKQYCATVTVGGVVGIAERCFEIGDVFSGYTNTMGTITIRIAEHSPLNDGPPTSASYQEFLDVPVDYLK